MRLKGHCNEKPKTRRKDYKMRSLFVIVVAVLLIIGMAAPIQTAEVQSTDDHTWGGDPDDPACMGWVSWWWYVMNVLYFYPLDII